VGRFQALDSSPVREALLANINDLVLACEKMTTTLKIKIAYENVPELLRQLAAQPVNIFSASQKNQLEAFFMAQAERK